jgi:hypothetical protein
MKFGRSTLVGMSWWPSGPPGLVLAMTLQACGLLLA